MDSQVAKWWRICLLMPEPQEKAGLIPGLERCPGVVNGNQLQYSCQEYLMDRGRATVCGVTKSQVQLSIHTLRMVPFMSSNLCLEPVLYLLTYFPIPTASEGSVHNQPKAKVSIFELCSQWRPLTSLKSADVASCSRDSHISLQFPLSCVSQSLHKHHIH